MPGGNGKMIYRDLVFYFLTLTYIQFPCASNTPSGLVKVNNALDVGTSASRFITNVQNSIKCAGLDEPQWKIDTLKYVTLDMWPQSCLQRRYKNDTLLYRAVSESSPGIYDAASKGYIGFVQFYGDRRGVDKMHVTRDEDGKTPLQLAIANGHLNIVKYAAIKSNLTASYFLSMFQEAVYQHQFEIVDYFIHDKTHIPNLHEDEEALISLAAVRTGNLRMLKYLIEQNGFPADVRDKELLYRAAEGGNLSMLKYLVENRTFVVEEDDYGLLYSAALGGDVDVLKYLINERHLRTDGTTYRGTILHGAAQSGKIEVVHFVVEVLHQEVHVTAPDGTTPAHIAAATSSTALRYLIEEKGADLNARRNNGDSLLHAAATAGCLPNVKYLVERKNVSIELKNRENMTCLYEAVRRGRLDVVKYLADERNASVNGKSAGGKNLLHQAVLGGSVDVMKYLVDDLKMQSRIEDTDSGNRTVAMFAAQEDSLKILKYLIGEKNASTAFVVDAQWISTGKSASRKLATIKYLIEEKRFDFNALPYSHPLKFMYLKYLPCRHKEVCETWNECPGNEFCQSWEDYLRQVKKSLRVLEQNRSTVASA